MRFFGSLQRIVSTIRHAGASGITDEDARRRVIMVNTICLSICVLLAAITPVCYLFAASNRVLVPAIFDFAITASVIYMNRRRLYSAASLTIYIVQCVAIMYFGLLLSNVVALEAMIIFLIAIIYLIFKDETLRRVALFTAMASLAAMEACNYFKVFEPIPMSSDAVFLLHSMIIWGVLVLILVVSRPYIRSNDELIKANYFKKMFLYQINHEIRTPLNAIYGVAQLLKREIKLDENLAGIQPLVDQQLEAIRNTRSIINNVLDMAQIESGNIEKTEKECFMPETFFARLIEVNRVIARPRQIRLKLDIAHMPEVIYDDLMKVHQIATNLLANAIKYANRNSVVELKVRRDGQHWQLQVINAGAQIPAEKIEVIFDPFVTDKSKYTEGTGLGLYIARGKVASLGGTIGLQSTAEGITTFTVTLPLTEGSLQDLQVDDQEADSFDDLENIHVLVAEDNTLNGLLLTGFLGKMGCFPVLVGNGLELIRQAEKQRPDIIIMDYHMEVMDGSEALAHLKKHPRLKDVPVIISTGDSFSETRDAFIAAGADAFIEKPVNYKSLMKLLKQHLRYNKEASLQ